MRYCRNPEELALKCNCRSLVDVKGCEDVSKEMLQKEEDPLTVAVCV